MATRLHQVVTFTAVGAGATVALAHSINVDGVPWIPDRVFVDNGNFSVVSVTTTTVTVKNNGAAGSNCDVWLERFHSVERAFGTFGPSQTHNLTPNPFVAAAGSSAGNPQSFRYIATGAEGTDFSITLPAARATDVYRVQMTQAGVTNILGYDLPDILAGDRTTLAFRVVTTGAVSAGDQFDIFVTDVLP